MSTYESVIGSVLDPRGDAARSIASLWWLMLAVGGTIALGVIAAVLIGARRPGASATSTPSDFERSANGWILGGGVMLPVVVVGVILGATIWTMRTTSRRAPDDALRIEVTGHQWWWEASYPSHGVRTANELHIPAREPVELVLQSDDVIHSFWVPALAGKLDALPERSTSLVIEADEPGRFEARCAEFCGIQHANMDLTVVAHERDDFENWIERRAAPARGPTTVMEQRGLEIVVGSTCATCHRIDGTAADGDDGPDLTHLASRDAIAGGMLDATRVDLVTWITDPHGVKPGALMPAASLSDDDIEAVAAYLESLE